jgi:hypothetical protein
MCTVSWLKQTDGYQVFCNRDERRTRKRAHAPRIQERSGVRFIAPEDGDCGGTWIGVNEYGLTLSLLNLYQEQGDAALNDAFTRHELSSRGLLLIELLDCPSRASVKDRLPATALDRFQPFTLLLLCTDGPPLLARWSGRQLSFESGGDVAPPLISSSFKTAEVVALRREQFRHLTANATQLSFDRLYEFHRSHEPTASAYSVCMHRDDAQTVSFSWINVTGQKIEFWYHPQALCQREIPTRVVLPLVQTQPRPVEVRI